MKYMVMRLNRWETIEIFNTPLRVTAGSGMPTGGFVSVWNTLEEAEADSEDGKYAIFPIQEIDPTATEARQ